MDGLVISDFADSCELHRELSMESNIFAVDELSTTDGFSGGEGYIFDSYRGMDELPSPLTSSESSVCNTKEIFGLIDDGCSGGYGEAYGSVFGMNFPVLGDITQELVTTEPGKKRWNVVIRFDGMKKRYREMVLNRRGRHLAETSYLEQTLMYEFDGESDISPMDECSRHDWMRPSEQFNKDSDKSVDQFEDEVALEEIASGIECEQNYFQLVLLQAMKNDPAYSLPAAAKPKIVSQDYENRLNKITRIDNDKYFSRINVRELSHILELNHFNISLTREIELNVLNVFQFYCKFLLGHKTWIRDTNKAQRKELISKLHQYISQWYPELSKFKLEVIIRRGSYSIMQRRLRRERRHRKRHA